jgi:hypothetical protein
VGDHAVNRFVGESMPNQRRNRFRHRALPVIARVEDVAQFPGAQMRFGLLETDLPDHFVLGS